MKRYFLVGGKINPSYKVDIEEKKMFNKLNYAYTYGEITRSGLKNILEGFNTENKIFYDLGSGIGKSLIYAITDHKFIRAVGIEFSKKRVQQSLNLVNSQPKDISSKIEVIHGDIFDPNINISDADFLFISNLCFSEESNEKLVEKINKMAKINAIIMCSRELHSKQMKLIKKTFTIMSWSNTSPIYIYKKLML